MVGKSKLMAWTVKSDVEGGGDFGGSGRARQVRRVGDSRKAIAMVGWGHLVCPFVRPRSGGARRGESGELRALVRSGRSASADGPEARESRREYQAD